MSFRTVIKSPGFVTLEDGAGSLSRIVGEVLQLLTASYPRRAHFSNTSRQKLEITEGAFYLRLRPRNLVARICPFTVLKEFEILCV